jgi:hypothetical protein
VSAALDWRGIVDLRFVWLGVVLLVLGIALASSAVLLFWREDTEINPPSEANCTCARRSGSDGSTGW